MFINSPGATKVPENVQTRLLGEAAESALDVVAANFYGVLGTREPFATSSGVESFVGCHALNCYS